MYANAVIVDGSANQMIINSIFQQATIRLTLEVESQIIVISAYCAISSNGNCAVCTLTYSRRTVRETTDHLIQDVYIAYCRVYAGIRRQLARTASVGYSVEITYCKHPLRAHVCCHSNKRHHSTNLYCCPCVHRVAHKNAPSEPT